MKKVQIVFLKNKFFTIAKTTGGKFKVYDIEERATVEEFDTLRKASNFVKIKSKEKSKPKIDEPKIDEPKIDEPKIDVIERPKKKLKQKKKKKK